jgi:hypothetical protein
MYLNKQQILSVVDLPIESVDVPEWGKDAKVFVRGLNGQERDNFEISISDEKHKGKINLENIRAKLCAMTICDEKGERLFSDKEVFALSKKNSVALSRIFVIAQKLSGLTEKDVEELQQDFLQPDKKEDSTLN